MTLEYKYHGRPRSYHLVKSIGEMTELQRTAYYNFLMGVGDTYAIVPILWQIPIRELKHLNEEQRYWLYQCILEDFEKPSGWIISDFKGLTAPADNMAGSSWGEFYSASTYLNKYRRHKQAEDLHKFLSCLYFDRSQPWSPEVPNNYRFFQNTSAGFIFAAILSFSYVEERLKGMFRYVFPDPEENDMAIATTGPAESLTWLDITLAANDYDPVRMVQYQKLDMYLVLKSLDEKIKANKKRK